MSPEIGRRAFLQNAGALALAGAAGVPAVDEAAVRRHHGKSHHAGAAHKAVASLDVRPAQVAKIPRLLPGCCAYSYGKYLNLKHPRMTLEDFIRNAVALKLNAVDMTGYYFRSRHPAYLASLRQLAYKNGVAFSGAACGVSMVQADPAQRKLALAQIRQWTDVADRLGAPHLRVFAGKLPSGHLLAEAVAWVVETLKPACDYAGQRGIMIGVEDHQGVTQNAEVCLEILHRVNSPWAGINLDITHFVPAPNLDRYRQIEMCVPFATNTHIRDEFDDRTPIDMDRVWQIFVRAGFKGYMSVEYEKKLAHGEDAATGVPKLVAEVRRLCAKYSSV